MAPLNRALALLFACLCAFATGFVQQSAVQPLGTTGNYALTFYWTGDAASGAVPTTLANLGTIAQGLRILQVETVPGTPAPTSGYSVQLVDSFGGDIMTGNLSSLGSTAAQFFSATSGTPPLLGAFSLKITGQSVAGAQGKVVVYFGPTMLVNANTGAQGPAGPQGPAGASGSGGAVSFNTDQATGNGTTSSFTLSGTPLSGSLIVSVNGQVQEAGSTADYTLSGTTVSFATPSIPGSAARILFTYAISTGSGTPTVSFTTDQATGTGSQTAFTLSGTPMTGSLIAVVNGQIQDAGSTADYTLSTNVVTFNSASTPGSGARILFYYGVSTASSSGQISMSQLPAGVANGLATLGSNGMVLPAQLPTAVANGLATLGSNGMVLPAQLPTAVANGLATLGSNGLVPTAQLPAGVANGLATLGSNGLVLSSQLPASTGGSSSGNQIFSATGSTTWTVPSGITRVYVEAWGGGAGGWSAYYTQGYGGPGGGYVWGWCPVTAGATVTVTVGAGGAAGSGNGAIGPGGNGGNSSFGTCLTALGGQWSSTKQLPGMDSAAPQGFYLWTNPTAGNANTYTYSFMSSNAPTSTTTSLWLPTGMDMGGLGGSQQNTTGYAGYAGNPALGGGAGGGSGAHDNTGTLTFAATAGGVSQKGGAGGNGAGTPYSSSPCTAGSVPGGGGGGSSWDGLPTSSPVQHPGCAGGAGLVKLWW